MILPQVKTGSVGSLLKSTYVTMKGAGEFYVLVLLLETLGEDLILEI